MSKYKEPRLTFSKKDSVCTETGKTILQGMDCLVYPGTGKIYCAESDQYKKFQKNRKS